MLQRIFKIARHAEQFSIRIVRVRFMGKQIDVTIHRTEGLAELPVASVGISQIVQRSRIIFVDGQSALEQLLGLIVSVLRHEPITSDI